MQCPPHKQGQAKATDGGKLSPKTVQTKSKVAEANSEEQEHLSASRRQKGDGHDNNKCDPKRLLCFQLHAAFLSNKKEQHFCVCLRKLLENVRLRNNREDAKGAHSKSGKRPRINWSTRTKHCFKAKKTQERETHTHKERERKKTQIERETDRQRKTRRETDRQKDRERGGEGDRQTERERQTDRQTDREGGREGAREEETRRRKQRTRQGRTISDQTEGWGLGQKQRKRRQQIQQDGPVAQRDSVVPGIRHIQ